MNCEGKRKLNLPPPLKSVIAPPSENWMFNSNVHNSPSTLARIFCLTSGGFCLIFSLQIYISGLSLLASLRRLCDILFVKPRLYRSNSTQLNSTSSWVELRCCAINGALVVAFWRNTEHINHRRIDQWRAQNLNHAYVAYTYSGRTFWTLCKSV